MGRKKESRCEQSCRGDNELVTVGENARELMSFAGCVQEFCI